MEGSQVLIAVTAKKFHVAQRLGAFVLNCKTTVCILDVVRRGNNIIGDFKKICIITTIWTFKEVRYCWLVKGHDRNSFFHPFL